MAANAGAPSSCLTSSTPAASRARSCSLSTVSHDRAGLDRPFTRRRHHDDEEPCAVRDVGTEVVDREQLQVVATQERRGDETVRVPRHVGRSRRSTGWAAWLRRCRPTPVHRRRTPAAGAASRSLPAETTTASPSIVVPSASSTPVARPPSTVTRTTSTSARQLNASDIGQVRVEGGDAAAGAAGQHRPVGVGRRRQEGPVDRPELGCRRAAPSARGCGRTRQRCRTSPRSGTARRRPRWRSCR